MKVDLRSDFLGPPTPEILEAMAAATSEPEGFELRESRHQRALEARAAEMLGKEDALFFPTCTMANLAAVLAQVSPGAAVVADASSHCVLSEAGGIAAFAGALVWPLPGEAGVLPIADLTAALSVRPDPQRPPVQLVILETTHNRSGGMPLPLTQIQEVGELAQRAGAGLHIDGARFFNAALALRVDPAEMAAPATTVALSLNKGLCAPNGALLVGSRALIEQALVHRQRLGGGLRPTGGLAAAGLVALDTMLPQLQKDHDNARELVLALRHYGFRAGPHPGGTNIVLVGAGQRPEKLQAFVSALAERGVFTIPFGPGQLRMCLHRGVRSAHIPAIAAAFQSARRALGGFELEN